MSDVSLNERVKLLAQRIGEECKKKLNKDVVATETTKGIVELATSDEVKAGIDATRAVTPATLKIMLETFWDDKIPAGIILPWAGKSNKAPDGFLLLDNSIVEANDFPRLAALGTFPVQDGKMTLTAPPEGYALGFTQSAEKVMTIQNGKLPNITGGLGYIYSENSTADNLFARNGALYWSGEAKRGATTSVTERAAVNIVFDASLSNSIYSGGKFLANNMLVRFIVSY